MFGRAFTKIGKVAMNASMHHNNRQNLIKSASPVAAHTMSSKLASSFSSQSILCQHMYLIFQHR